MFLLRIQSIITRLRALYHKISTAILNKIKLLNLYQRPNKTITKNHRIIKFRLEIKIKLRLFLQLQLRLIQPHH